MSTKLPKSASEVPSFDQSHWKRKKDSYIYVFNLKLPYLLAYLASYEGNR